MSSSGKWLVEIIRWNNVVQKVSNLNPVHMMKRKFGLHPRNILEKKKLAFDSYKIPFFDPYCFRDLEQNERTCT